MTTWKELNWFKFEANVFVEELKGPFTTIFALAENEFQQTRKQRDQDISKKPDNEYMGEELSWSEERLQNESQIITAMIFTVAYRATQNFLNRLLYWATNQKSDVEKLPRLEAEYQKIGLLLADQNEFRHH